jgi:methyl-accepting chemotaxis protein
MTLIFVVMMLIILATFVVFYLFITGLLKPLNTMVTTLGQISADWDLTRRLEIKQKDETGILAEFFNQTFDRIGALIREIKGKALGLEDTGDELKHTMDETARSIEKINDNIQSMRGMVLNQADEVNTASSSMEQIIKGLDNLNDHIVIQADAVTKSSSAIEEMLANIRSVTETLVKNTANINSLAASSEAGRVDIQKVSQDIQEIARESEGLLEINSVMQAISSQTNLLSMNAAIEAAHAGESGKGFAVVADEIRKLAENSGKQSKIISTVLKKIKSSIDAISKSAGIVLERFGTIEQEVETVSNQETHIRNAMEEQGVGSRDILQAITQLNNVTSEVRSSSSQMTATSRGVLKQSANLKRISGEVAEGMDNMSESAESISGAVVRVQEISKENQENIGILEGEISRFKVDR